MREIKFRAWDNEFGTMVHEFTKDGYSTDMQNGRLAVGSNDGNGDYFELPLMQFTGLLDKNGKEIYEGDIVTFLNGEITSTENGMDCDEFITNGEVFWEYQNGQWDISGRIDVSRDEVVDDIDNMEVIGNIYENPELLKL